MSWSTAEAERVKALEIKQEELVKKIAEMNTKLDDLLMLKHKGLGALSLVTLILTSGFILSVTAMISWFRGG